MNLNRSLRALLVMPRGRQPAWIVRLKRCGVAVAATAGINEACQVIASPERPDFILTDETVSDADWRQVLEEALDWDRNSLVVVCVRFAPDSNFWSEALHRGAYDVITESDIDVPLASLVRTAALRRGVIRMTAQHSSGGYLDDAAVRTA